MRLTLITIYYLDRYKDLKDYINHAKQRQLMAIQQLHKV
jgi:hypothetical protein